MKEEKKKKNSRKEHTKNLNTNENLLCNETASYHANQKEKKNGIE